MVPGDRFRPVRSLGEGAYGSVYLAVDAETGSQVAVKKLLRLDDKSVRRFKREFRALTGLHHPNLVKLYELVHGGDAWLLTMEVVEGRDLKALLSRRADDQPAWNAELVGTFEQLACGIAALHRAGLLHRDLKPSNVMVAHDGRVVLLDFGLVRDLAYEDQQLTQDGTVTGTPAYMAPEQAQAQPLGEASDWYAFGTMLYEALSGRLPIDGRNPHQLLQRKLSVEPAPLAHAAPGVPRELSELCMALLSREPTQRPAGEHVLSVLRAWGPQPAQRERTVTASQSLPLERPREAAALIGRESELLQLQAAYAAAARREVLAVEVRAASGEGKTALLDHFLARLEREAPERPLLLRSRCYERESTPFKALDGLMEGLLSHLGRLDELQLANVLPRELPELLATFPALQSLPVVARLAWTQRAHPDPARARRRAEDGLRSLIATLAAEHPLVLWIDDLQWGDLDSANVLRDWLHEPLAGSLLLVFSFRSDELQSSPCLRTIELQSDAAGGCRRVRIDLGSLRERDVRELCLRRLPAGSDAAVARIVSEAGGNAFLASQLVALCEAMLGRGELDLADVSVSELVLRARALLPPGAAELLDVLAAAGRPVSAQLALSAAGSMDGRAHIHALQGLRLLRTRELGATRLIEIYHDRVREALQASWSAARSVELHVRLLHALERAGRLDHDWLHELALRAEQPERALRHGLIAAERAEGGFAFERAAEIYASCLRLTEQAEQRAALFQRLARVLARSRRGAQAADAYLEAAKLVAPREQLRLLQLAASHLLRTGRFDEGETLVQRVLAAEGVSVPGTELGLYAAIGWERARLALRGEAFARHDRVADDDSEHRRRFDLYGKLAVETQFFAPLRAALFQARAMRESLASADAHCLARGLCVTAAVMSLAGTQRAARQTGRLLARAQELARELDSPDLHSELYCARTLCGFLLGDMHDAVAASDLAAELYRTRRTGGEHGDYYYMFAMQTARLGALQVLGRYQHAAGELAELLTRAAATANLTAELQVTFVRAALEQVLGRAHESRPRLDRERELLPKQGTGVLHVLHLIAALWAAAQTGEFEWARSILERYWEPCLRSPVRHSLVLRNFMHAARARLLLNEHVATGRKGDPGAIIRQDLRALDGMRGSVRIDPSKRYHARIAYLRGDRERARVLLSQFLHELETAGVLEEAERERYALGCLLGGEQGLSQQAAAYAASRARGVVDPLAMLRGTYPEIVEDAQLYVPREHT